MNAKFNVLLLGIIFCLIGTLVQAQIPSQFLKLYGDSREENGAHAIETSDGGYLVVGQSDRTHSDTRQSILVVRTNKDGVIQAFQMIEHPTANLTPRRVVEAAGGFVILAHRGSTPVVIGLDVGATVITFARTFANGGTGFSPAFRFNDLQPTADGGVVMVGGPLQLNNIHVAKLSNTGALDFYAIFGENSDPEISNIFGTSVRETGDGQYMVGASNGLLAGNSNLHQAIAFRLDATGASNFARSYGGVSSGSPTPATGLSSATVIPITPTRYAIMGEYQNFANGVTDGKLFFVNDRINGTQMAQAVYSSTDNITLADASDAGPFSYLLGGNLGGDIWALNLSFTGGISSQGKVDLGLSKSMRSIEFGEKSIVICGSGTKSIGGFVDTDMLLYKGPKNFDDADCGNPYAGIMVASNNAIQHCAYPHTSFIPAFVTANEGLLTAFNNVDPATRIECFESEHIPCGPDVIAQANPGVVCLGDPVTYSAWDPNTGVPNPLVTYTWYNSNGIVSVGPVTGPHPYDPSEGAYYVVASLPDGCSTTYQPLLGTTSDCDQCLAEFTWVAQSNMEGSCTVTFTDQSLPSGFITSWIWDFGDMTGYNGANPPPHTYTGMMPSYNVCLTITTMENCTHTFCQPVGCGRFRMAGQVEPSFTLYPNPASTNLNLDYQLTGDGTSTFLLYDLTGRVVKTAPLDEAESFRSFELEGITNGIYMARITSGDKTVFSQKVVVRK